MFLFLKYVYPTLYKKHFGTEEEHQEADRLEGQRYGRQLESASLLLSQTEDKSQRRSVASGLFGKIKSNMFSRIRRGKSDESEQLVEVFDVLLRSKHRLELFDLESSRNVLMNQQKSNYLAAVR